MPVKLCKCKPVSETGCQTNRSSKKLWKANQCCTRFCKKMITKFVGIFSLSWKRSCRTELYWCVRRIFTSIGFTPLYGYILLNSSLNCAWFIFFRVLITARTWNGKICTQMSHRGVNEQCKYVLFLLKARVKSLLLILIILICTSKERFAETMRRTCFHEWQNQSRTQSLRSDSGDGNIGSGITQQNY